MNQIQVSALEGEMDLSPRLFDPLVIRDVRFRNRIGVSPMCMYSATGGLPNDWHLVHLGSRAVGGAGFVMAEATAVNPFGRITPGDTGIWNDSQAEAWAPVAKFIEGQGAVSGIQLAHAGKKSGYRIPWEGTGALDDPTWIRPAPSAIAFAEGHPVPHELTVNEIGELVRDFKDAAERALGSGFRVVEIHGAHGYLVHEFLSPISNQRTDEYGGSFENRTRFVREIAAAIRTVWPERLPLFVRFSATDWVEGGWDIEQSIELARVLKGLGVDMVDCSSGGIVASATIPIAPGYQIDFARRIRDEAGVMTAAVGMITEPSQANAAVTDGKADMVLLARELLRDPYWPRRAAAELGEKIDPPVQYGRSW